MPRKPKPLPQREHGAAKSPVKSPAKAKSKPPSTGKANGKAKRATKQKPAPAVILAASEGIGGETVTGDVPKHPGGRPTKYDPAYCDLAIELGKQGKSTEVIACHIGVVHQTVLNWSNAHPEFLEAITLAKQYELLWWENAGQENLTTTGFSASAWSRSMAARFPSKWREKTQVDHGISSDFAAFLSQIDGHGASLI